MEFDFRIGSAADNMAAIAPKESTAITEEGKATALTMDKKDQDRITISTEAKELLEKSQSNTAKTEESGSETSSEDEMIEKVKEQIEKLTQEIEKMKQQGSESNKEQIAAKEEQLLQLQGQLSELMAQKMKNAGTSSAGGTKAQGFSNSLT